MISQIFILVKVKVKVKVEVENGRCYEDYIFAALSLLEKCLFFIMFCYVI